MANEENLIPKTSDQSREEAKRNGSKGGKASGAARRRKKAMKDSANALLSMNVGSMKGGGIDKIKALLRSFGYDDEEATVQDAILISWLLSAMKGDVQAGKLLRDTAGESPDMEVNTYRLPDEKFTVAKMYLEGQYGVYSYDEIKRNTYVQGLAQMFRRVEKSDEVRKENHSQLYKNLVLPYLSTHDDVSTVLDFGCGKGAYIEHLKSKYKAIGVEFYNNNGKSINVTKGNQQIDSLLRYLEVRKRFDVVVCDSVLNSVDSVKAEQSVVTCCNLFCGGKLFISGRPYDEQVRKMQCDRSIGTNKRNIEFLDDNKFTAIYRKGNWYFQHYHLPEDVEQLLDRCGFKIDKMTWRKYGSSWQVEATKVRDLTSEEYIAAVDFEFNLPLPGDKSYNRHGEVKRVLGLI